jgi:hypothetical protein
MTSAHGYQLHDVDRAWVDLNIMSGLDRKGKNGRVS